MSRPRKWTRTKIPSSAEEGPKDPRRRRIRDSAEDAGLVSARAEAWGRRGLRRAAAPARDRRRPEDRNLPERVFSNTEMSPNWVEVGRCEGAFVAFARIRWIPSGFGRNGCFRIYGEARAEADRTFTPREIGAFGASRRIPAPGFVCCPGLRRRLFAGRREAAGVPGIEPKDPPTVRRPRPGRRSRKASRSALSGLPPLRRRPEVRLPLSASVDVGALPSPRPSETAGNVGRASAT